MVTGDDHQRAQDDLGVTGLLDLLDNGIAGGVLGFTLDGADKDVVIAQRLHRGLHLAVADLGGVGRAVAHKDKGGAVRSGGSGVVISGGLDGLGGDGGGYGLLVVVDDGGIFADLAQQGFGNGNAVELVPVLLNRLAHLVVLGAVHQVRRLDNQILDAVGNGTVKRLVHVVDLLAVAGLNVVDDDLRGEGAADAPIRVGGLQGVLNALDVSGAAAVEGGAEADDQQLIFADVVGIARVVLAGVAGVAAKVVGVCVLTLDQLLLGVGQGIPGSLGGLALGIGVGAALLHVDGVDQIGAVLSGHFVCISLVCGLFCIFCGAFCGAFVGDGARGSAVSARGGAAAADQQGGGQCCGHGDGGSFLVGDPSHVFLLPFLV